jgi:hypothetical protein
MARWVLITLLTPDSTNPLHFSHREKIMEQGDLAEDFRARAREASRRFRQK